MKGCEKFHELISLAVDGEISVNDEKLLNAHLSVCSECASLLELYKMISAELSDMQAEPPDMLASDIMKEIKKQSKRRSGRFTMFSRAVASLAAVVVIVIAANEVLPIQDMREAAAYNAAFMPNKIDSQPQMAVFSTPVIIYTDKTETDVQESESYAGALNGNAAPAQQMIEKERDDSADALPDQAEQLQAAGNVDYIEEAVPEATATPAPAETPKTGYTSSSRFGVDLRAKEIWTSNSFEKAYYCVAVINETSAGELSGYEQLSKSDSEIYYKVPVDIIDKFQKNKALTEIMYNNNNAEYGIVIMKLKKSIK